MNLLTCVLATMLLLHVAHSQPEASEASSQQVDARAILDQARERMATFLAYSRETVEILDQLSHYHPEETEEADASQHPQVSTQEKISAKVAVAALVVSAATVGVSTGVGLTVAFAVNS